MCRNCIGKCTGNFAQPGNLEFFPVQGGYKGTCWLTSPVAWTTHIPTDAMAQLTYSAVGSLRMQHCH